MEKYLSYEKEVINRVETVRHIVRIRLNESAASVMETLKNVPVTAFVSMVVDDTKLERYGEIVFEEQNPIQ